MKLVKVMNKMIWISMRMWFRKNFVNWVFFQMFGGNRPSETSKLTYGDVRVDEHKLPNGVTTLRGIVEIPQDTKTGKRTMVMNGTSIRRIFEHFHYSKHPNGCHMRLLMTHHSS